LRQGLTAHPRLDRPAGHGVSAAAGMRLPDHRELGLRGGRLARAGTVAAGGRPALGLPAEDPDSADGRPAHPAGPGGTVAQRPAPVRPGCSTRGNPRRTGRRPLMEAMALLLFACICLVLMAGYPVAFSLAGVSLAFAGIGTLTGG